MDIQEFTENIQNLEKALYSSNSLKVNDSLMVNLIVNDLNPLLIQIKYNPIQQNISIIAPMMLSLPGSIRGLQDIMCKLFQDLIIHEKKIGKLVANHETSTLNYVKFLESEIYDPFLLANFLPKFIEEAKIWKSKISKTQKKRPSISCLEAEEVLNFNYHIS
ncbi:MAG: hypothetical protein S4CHLAM7_01540 [Chlamydiae bacterium]|nr:hypothetical protein [Chlamydiota bacterium]